MMAVQEQTRTTMAADAFLALPETNLPTELIDGEVIMAPAPTIDHQDIVGNIFVLVRGLAKPKGGKVYISPMDVKLDEANVVQPDILWVAPDSKCKPVGRRYFEGAPDLAVEVLSPGTSRRDKKTKYALYEKHGVREYWVADPEGQWLEAWKLGEDGKFAPLGVFGPEDVFESPLLGAAALAEIFIPAEQ